MTRQSILVCAAAFALTGFASLAAAADTREAQNYRQTIEGAWEVMVTLRLPAADCTTSPPVPFGPNPFPSFNTFHEGGTVSEWGSRAPPATRSSGHGVWERTGPRQFSYHLKFHSFDANGLLAATMDIATDLALSDDGKIFEGVSRFIRTDISGNALNFCATMSGSRMTLQVPGV